MRPTNDENEFSQFLHKEGLYENIFKYICHMIVKFNLIEFFEDGPAFLDELFYSKVFKNLTLDKQMEILDLLNIDESLRNFESLASEIKSGQKINAPQIIFPNIKN